VGDRDGVSVAEIDSELDSDTVKEVVSELVLDSTLLREYVIEHVNFPYGIAHT
jgi:hypothetical protein